MSEESISLYYKEGSSDKVYHAQLEQKDNAWVVNFQYGPRGGTLTAGCKTKTPVAYAVAKKAYDKLVHEKTAKGYTTGESGVRYQDTSLSGRVTGLLPQLLNPITEATLQACLGDAHYGVQEKMDGERRMVRMGGGSVATGVNRNGLAVALPVPMAADLSRLSEGTELDAEEVGGVLYCFDMLNDGGEDLRGLPYLERFVRMTVTLAQLKDSETVKVVPLLLGGDLAVNQKFVNEVRDRRGEGVVLKDLAAAYTVGRPNSGGSQLKYKFVESATLRIAALHKTKSSAQIEAVIDDMGIPLGNVKIPPKVTVKVGDIVEVLYLYAYPNGSLYQPVFKGLRPDQTVAACTTRQLKFKAAGPARDEDDVAPSEELGLGI